jgi:membrane associated rhomboid family serine protease
MPIGSSPDGSSQDDPPGNVFGDTPDPVEHPGAALLGPYSGSRLREASLVLRSMGIQHFVEPAERLGSYLLVLERDKHRSEVALRRYEEENRNWPPRQTRERPSYDGLPFVALAFVLLILFSWVTGPAARNSAWFEHGTSVAELVMRGHPERAVTALTLHADSTHVFGNVLSGAIFGHLVERRMGPGLGLLSVLASGALGNLANAAYYFTQGEPHASIGASTAVMGAVGVLAATQAFVHRSQPKKRSWGDWAAPLMGGLALLGTLGSGAESDLGAHGFGFVGGLVAGGVLFLAFQKKRASALLQVGFGIASAAIICGSWAVAMAR